MTLRRAPLALVLLLAATPCLAALDKHKDWEKSPASVYLATDDEKKEWKKIASDEEAEKFIALFWARRDPDLKTPANEFRERFDILVKKADELFPLGRKRGALTERGRALILIGPPKSTANKAIVSSRPELDSSNPTTGATGADVLGSSSGMKAVMVQWLYEKPQLPAWADIPSLDLKFEVDQSALVERLIDGRAATRLETKAAQVALVNPQLKEVPVYKTKEQVAAEQKAAADKAAEQSISNALNTLKKGDKVTARDGRYFSA